MEIPKTIRIGPLDFAVILVEDLTEDDRAQKLDGHIRFSECDIRIEANLNAQSALQVVWHEVLHGLLVMSEDAPNRKEALVNRLAYGIMQVLRDNEYLSSVATG